MELIEKKITLPLSLCKRIDRLGEMCGLTGDQMGNAILILQFQAHGWLKDELADLPPVPKEDPIQNLDAD